LTYFRKIFNYIKFDKSPSSGSGVVPFGRTDRQKDRHDGAKSRFSQFANTNKSPAVINQVQTHICYTNIHAVIYMGHYTSNLDATLNFFAAFFSLRTAKLGHY